MLLTLTHSLIRDSSIRLTHQLWDEIFFKKKRKKKKEALLMFISWSQTCSSPPPPKVFHTGAMWTGPYVNAKVCLECEDRRSVPGCVEDKLHGVLVHHSCSRTLTFDTLRQRCMKHWKESCVLWKNYERGCRRVVALSQSCQVYKPRCEAVVTLRSSSSVDGTSALTGTHKCFVLSGESRLSVAHKCWAFAVSASLDYRATGWVVTWLRRSEQLIQRQVFSFTCSVNQ